MRYLWKVVDACPVWRSSRSTGVGSKAMNCCGQAQQQGHLKNEAHLKSLLHSECFHHFVLLPHITVVSCQKRRSDSRVKW